MKGPVTFHAALKYRKVDQYLLNVITGNAGVTCPVTEMSDASAVTEVEETLR